MQDVFQEHGQSTSKQLKFVSQIWHNSVLNTICWPQNAMLYVVTRPAKIKIDCLSQWDQGGERES